MDPRLEKAESRRAQSERVLALLTRMRALVAGDLTRADMSKWLAELRPPGSGQRGPFIHQPALSVYESLCLDELWEGQPLVRDVDLRAYLRWLSEGESFHASGDDTLFVLAVDIEEFAAQTRTEAIRWWHSGLGWRVSLQFASPVSGRAYLIHSGLEHPGRIGLHKQDRYDLHEAIVDLFEALAIDEQDVTHLHRDVDLSRLPTWALWREDFNNSGNRFEVARYHSYAKACVQARVFTERDNQTYWVDPA